MEKELHLRSIGNSKGFIIPNEILKLVGIQHSVTLEISDNCLILKAMSDEKKPRKNWKTSIMQDMPSQKEVAFMDSIIDKECLDEWTW